MPGSIDLEFPFRGRWLTQNSPADRVPSHGTTLFASSYAVDFVPVDAAGRTAPFRLGSLVLPERPETFPGFGRAVLAPVEGIVIATHDGEADHPAYRGLPSVGYALTQRRRAAAGWESLAGNHLLIDSGDAVVVLCHLRRGSITVRTGQRAAVGDLVGRCGNSGNSTQPHLHVQAIDVPDVERAEGLPLSFDGTLPRNGQVVDA